LAAKYVVMGRRARRAMPKMNGVEFAEKVRERFPALPVILATGYAELPANTTRELPRPAATTLFATD
jgi:CheY-like chemotaxis protein